MFKDMSFMENKFTGVVVGTKKKEKGYGREKEEWLASEVRIENSADEVSDTLWIFGEYKIGTVVEISCLVL